jgi:hypothetical protein
VLELCVARAVGLHRVSYSRVVCDADLVEAVDERLNFESERELV